VGDGSALYTIQALWTAAHHRIPVTWVIANNRSYRILKLNMLDYLGEGAAGREFVAMDMTEPALDFAQIAASFGVKGVRIEHPDEIGDALREAQGSGEPRLLDIVIDGDVKSRWL
ncbi:MAG: thiamine pyrophosphate-binding protein, partial [Chloroflexi bacterium]|nr:thiamine pyrophosphate-binding protein [Chloroflexota bacterium]